VADFHVTSLHDEKGPLEHVAVQAVIWAEGKAISRLKKKKTTDCFSRRKMGCRPLLREWYKRNSVLAIPVGALWWHVDFQCYRCAHCGDSHQHAAQLRRSCQHASTSSTHTGIYMFISTEHVTLNHDCLALTGWILELCSHNLPIHKTDFVFPLQREPLS
jgi:hypothetical protein